MPTNPPSSAANRRAPAARRVRLQRASLAVLGASLALDATAQTAEQPPAAAAPAASAPSAASAAVSAPNAAPAAAASSNTLAPVVVVGRAAGYTAPDSTAATRLTLSPRETPQSMTVITEERMQDQQLDSLRQVLDNTPGVYSNAYDTERVLFYSRGFLITSLMFDGVPAIQNFNTGSVDETVDTAPFERIEVVRGATGLMTGAGSPAASINMVRKHADSRSPTASFDLTLGSWSQGRAVIDASTPLNADGSVRARGVAVAETTDSFQDLYSKKTYVLYGIVDADLSSATRVSLGVNYQDNQPRSNTWGSFPLFLADGQLANWPRSVTTATDWTYWNRRTTTVFGELRQNLDAGWTLRSTLSWRRYNEDMKLFYVYGFPDPQTGLGLEPYAYGGEGRITETALDVYATGPFELAGRRHELVVGYNGSRAHNTATEYNPVGDLPPTGNFFQWDGSYPLPVFDGGTPSTDITTTQQGLYGAARFSLADPLKLIAGARLAQWKVDSYYIYDTPANSRYDYNKTIPYAGLVWDLTPQVSMFASYTSIFQPQNARDINGHYLDPMDGRSYEVGIKGEHFDRQLNTALTLFETRQNNVATALIDPITGDPVTLPDNLAVSYGVDGTRTRGFEIEASGRLGKEVQATFGWTHYQMRGPDGEAVRTFIPSTLVRLWATWEPRSWAPGLTLGGGVNWQSASSTIVGAPAGPTVLRQGDVTQVSLMARYAFSPSVSLQFNANNLLDQKYYVLDQYDNTFYGAPANYSLTLQLAY